MEKKAENQRKLEKERQKEERLKQQNDHYSKKADELKFSEEIDDAYTNKLVGRYEKGYRQNKCLIVSGYLSIIFGVLCVLAMIIADIALAIKGADGEYDLESHKTTLVVGSIVAVVYGAISILIGLRVKTFANFTRRVYMAHTAQIMLFAILQFFFGGIFTALLTIIGYFVGRGIDYGAIYYNRIDGYNNPTEKEEGSIDKELKFLKGEYGEYFDDDDELHLCQRQKKF